MMLRQPSRRLAALAALFAVVLQGFLPLLAQAQPGTRTLLVPLCGVKGGSHTLEITTGKPATAGEHCKHCVFGDGKGVALVANEFSPLTLKRLANQIDPTPKASFHQATLNSAHPRAPPQIS